MKYGICAAFLILLGYRIKCGTMGPKCQVSPYKEGRGSENSGLMAPGIVYTLWHYKTCQHLLIQLWSLQEPFLLLPNSLKNPRRILGDVSELLLVSGEEKIRERIRWSWKVPMTWDERSPVSRACSLQLSLVKRSLFRTEKQYQGSPANPHDHGVNCAYRPVQVISPTVTLKVKVGTCICTSDLSHS